MFKDISLSIDNKKVDYESKVIKDKIVIGTINKLKIGDVLKIFYDENIYELTISTSFKKGKNGEIFINIANNEIFFSVSLKNNFFVKSVYKFMNELIDKEGLINEINLFINCNIEKKYKEDLNNLLETIENDNKSLEDLITNIEDEYARIFNILVNNNTYIDIAKNMSNLELMLLITSYICVPCIPKIDQDTFNDLINVAKKHDNDLENIWRLGMNFDDKGYNFDELDDFFVNSKNIWYLGEYISGIYQVNQEKIVNKIIETNDRRFIKQVLEDKFIMDNLDEKCKSILETFV